MTTEAGRAPCGARLAWDEVAVCSKHGVDCIDPDRLARALHEYADGAQPSIDLFCYHDDTDYEVRDTRPDRACHQVAAAILDLIRKEKP